MFALAFGALEILEAHFRRYAIGGLYFQGWTSERMMQSVSLRELRAAPIESLWYLHIQPPVTNLIRALIAAYHREATWDQLMRAVDRDLSHAWALAGAALGALIDGWLRRLRVPGVVSAFLTLGWLLYPANLAYVSLLDGTLLSSLLTTWILYETWRFGSAAVGSVGWLSAAVLSGYFTRSIFQWPFVPLILASLALLRVSRRRLLVFGLMVGLPIGLYSIKQAALFGSISTSTFQGLNLTNSIGADCKGVEPPRGGGHTRSTAAVLTERLKLDGEVNFNHVDQLEVERGLMKCFRRALAKSTLTSLWAAYSEDFAIFIRPSSRYQENAIADRLPWREPVDWLFSGWRLVSMTLVAGGLGILQAPRSARRSLAILLPAAYVLAACVVGERGENMRFKFFLEPAIYVLIAAQCWRVARLALAQAKRFAIRGPGGKSPV